MNIITSKAFQNIGLALGGALIALVAVVSMPAPAHAQEWGDSGSIDTGGGSDFGGYTGGDWSSSGDWGDTGSCTYGCGSDVYTGGDWSSSGDWGDTGSCTYGCGSDYSYDSADYGYSGDTGCGSGCGSTGSGFSMPSFGGSSGGFSMPSFGSANQQYRSSASYPVFYPPVTTPSKPGNTTVTTNTCTNNSCNYTDNSIVDNSVKISNSFNDQVQKKQQYNDCYDYGNTQHGYGQQGYNYGTYNYDNHCYTYAAPIAYNTTPYITLSQAPYTGLDLGPMGEVLYWTFLVLWCLGAAYLIVVKRVQNKLVGFLNGFLFSTSAPAAHATHTSVAHTTVAAHAPMVEEGIDPFIQSQIKRA